LHCLRHIHAILKKKDFHGLELKMDFWGASKAYTNLNYNTYMRDIRDVDTGVVNGLKNIPTETWVRHMFDP
jgi:hypothetical protein